MAINIKNTSYLATNGVKILVYGQAGAGKTSLIKGLESPIVLSAEGGLMSIADSGVPFIEIKSMETLKEAYEWLTKSKEAEQFASVALDSISEVAEVVLAYEMKRTKDGRAAYGEMNSAMVDIIRSFRDLGGKNVFFTAKLEKSQDEMGKMLYNPSMPGKSLTQALPYFFDELLALRIERDADGNCHRALMCDSDSAWLAKDRSGKLIAWEAPDLGAIINKIVGKP